MLCDAHLHSSHAPFADLPEGGLYLSCAASRSDWQVLLRDTRIKPFLGILPEYLTPGWEKDLEKLDMILRKHPGAGIGECGLDKRYYKTFPRREQERVLKSHFDLARKHGRSLCLHQVQASGALADFISREKPDTPIMIHGFRGSEEILKRCIRLGMYISIGPGDDRQQSGFPELIRKIPRERLLLETDWPGSSGTEDRSYIERLNRHYENVARALGIEKEALAGSIMKNGTVFTH
ncbi:TatD family hydrolase [Oceanispirochaeta sp.]|jgi:Tat protein secretion system quality control protein TatD with DNase activity|uniref:TatD family hydrolase n=1 Tax=Oceanispirochaeta sp. TaxID=2035350 RepID=UPI0026055B31|nr:TatD family hydrolase [Oceanispirochaeta sp.]MDA3958324.1 TatD family hydrolase [Oceanispirochaeta sp.]